VGVEQVGERGQIARRRGDHADVHQHRLDDHPGDLSGVVEEDTADGVEAAERDHVGEGGELRRHRRVLGHRARPVDGAGLGRLGIHRDLERVVVSVVAAFDLDQPPPPGDGAHQMDGGEGRFGPGVGEAPQREPEPPG
jgi:hypothetical protein